MSSNRLMYDQCAYTKSVNESVEPLSYVLNPMKYENCQKCRHELGLVGGTAVSHIQGNLVDLENDLRGTTRAASLCPSKKYNPTKNNNITIQGKSCGNTRNINTNLVHLPPCQMIRYTPTPLPKPMNIDNCPAPSMANPVACNNSNSCFPNCN